MPAARYWRITGVQSYGSDLELSELHLYDAGGRIDTAATTTSTIAPVSGTLGALADGDMTSTCRFAAADVWASGFAIVWDFGAGVTKEAVGLRLGAASLQRFAAAMTLEYSSDGSAWLVAQTFDRFAYPGVGAYTQIPVAGDASYESVSLLLHCDGPDGSALFVDKSPAPKVVDVVGAVKLNTAQPLFGGASAYFDGAESYLQIRRYDDLSFGAGDFAIEGWFRLASLTKQAVLFDFRPIDTNGPYIFLAVKTTGALLLYVNGAERIVGPGSTVAPGAFTKISCARVSGITRLFVNGIQTGPSWADSTNYATGPDFACRIGRGSIAVYSEEFHGHAGELRATKGVGRYSANYTVSLRRFAHAVVGATDGYLAPLQPTTRIHASAAASAPVAAHGTKALAGALVARDVEHGGPGTIYGTTKTKGTPNIATKARVVLLHQRSKLPVRETWSDPVTGDYAFHGIDTSQQFLVLAEDAAGNFRPVAANRLTPEVQP